jgi:hypothetical protein
MNYPWVELLIYGINPRIKNFNGGLSLRKKEDMLKIIESFPPAKTLDYSSIRQQQSNFSTYAEDVYFTIGCYKLNLNIGDDTESCKFACHTISYDKCFGIHNPNSYLQSILNDKYPELKHLNPSLFTP